jgi:hypothetical protein
MSVYSIAKQEAARRTADLPTIPATGAPAPPPPPAEPPIAAAAPTVTDAEIGQALQSIATYIPTEVMATYLAILAVIPGSSEHGYQWLMFWAFFAATPIVVWLSVSAAHPGQGLSLPLTAIRSWPWLSMLAATLAFAVFAAAVPGSVVSDLNWYQPWMATAAIILSAFALSQVNRFASAFKSAVGS